MNPGGMYAGYTDGYVKAEGQRVSVTRSNEYTHTELTNIQSKADTWGKVIPLGFGRHRVAGALVWASDFYATTSGFDETTSKQNIYTEYSFSSGRDAEAKGAGMFDVVVNPPQDVSQPPVTQVTHSQTKSSSIDLCYSFGKEGDKRRKRYVDKIRINDTLAYDSKTGYIAPGLAFSIRYGYNDDQIPGLMQGYDDGIYYYKGQTLIVFDKFPTGNYGDAIPSSVDVEFGCCAAPPEDPDNLDVHDSGWPIQFWVAEWGSEYLENPLKLAINPNNTQDGGALGYHLNPNWSMGPDIYVTGTAIVTGGDPKFAPDLNPVKILDNIHSTAGGGPNGSVWRFTKLMTREQFFTYQSTGGIPFLQGNGVERTGTNADAHGENYYEQNTVAYSIRGYSTGKPNVKIADKLISDTVDTKNTVSVQNFKGKGRTLYVTPLFRMNRGSYSIWVTLQNADGVNWPSFWNGGFTNGRAGGSHTEFLSRGDGKPYYIGKPGETFTYGLDPNAVAGMGGTVTGIAVTINSYTYFRNTYASE